MAERKVYKSALRSKKWIRQAFMELLKEKDFEKITVTDIVNRADINRSTFYAHYKDVYALVEEIQNEIVNCSIELLAELKYKSIFKDPMPFLQTLVKPVEENRELYMLLWRSNFAQQQLEKLKKVFVVQAMNAPEIPEEMRHTKMFAIRVNFFIGGIINAYQQWLQGELECTIDEITQDIAAIIASTAGTILDADWLK